MTRNHVVKLIQSLSGLAAYRVQIRLWPPSIEHPPHEMGQDTDTVLGELGYSAAEILRLRKARVV